MNIILGVLGNISGERYPEKKLYEAGYKGRIKQTTGKMIMLTAVTTNFSFSFFFLPQKSNILNPTSIGGLRGRRFSNPF